MWKNQLYVAILLAFYRSKNHVIQFRECRDMAIFGLDVISRWVRRLFTVTSQDKFLKLWKIYGKWGEMVPTRGYILRSDWLQFGPVATSFLPVFYFPEWKGNWTIAVLISMQLDQILVATSGWSGPVAVFFAVLNWTLNHYPCVHCLFSNSWFVFTVPAL